MTNYPDNNQTKSPGHDLGSGRSAVFAWVVAAAAYIMVVCVQQGLFTAKAPAPTTTKTASAIQPPNESDPTLSMGKVLVRLNAYAKAEKTEVPTWLKDQAVAATTHPLEQFRAAIIQAELAGPDPAIASLRTIDLAALDDKKSPHLSAQDAVILGQHRDFAIEILEGGGGAITHADREALIASHGYFGRLLLAQNLSQADPQRAPLVRYEGLVLALSFGGLIVLIGAVGGLIAFVVMLVWLISGKVKPAFVPPPPGGSVYIETLAVFLTLFISLQLAAHFLPESIRPSQTTRLVLQWLLLAAPFWPLLRGVRPADFRRQIGLHSGTGFWREVGSGVLGYFAGLPIFVLACALAVLAILIPRWFGGGEFEPPRNPIQDIVNQASTGTLVLVFMLATIWAPFVEESIFRGALYRHLRGRVGLAIAVPVVAIMFGFMHGYPLPLLLPVIALGGTIALMREWRGSLIAPITGHFLHNATVLTFGVLFAEAMK